MANLTNPQALETWGLRVHAHQVVNFFHSSGVSASVKQLTEYASDTVISILQRGATAEDIGEVSVPGRPHKAQLSYNPSCLSLHILIFIFFQSYRKRPWSAPLRQCIRSLKDISVYL